MSFPTLLSRGYNDIGAYRLVNQSQDQPDLNTALKAAEEAHGHLCPFLVLGVRMALLGARELGVQDQKDLRVTLMLETSKNFPPCFLDGIQITSQCTLENKRLRLENYSGIAAKFELKDKAQVTVEVNPIQLATISEKMKTVMAGNFTSDEFKQMVDFSLSTPDEDLFLMRKS